MFIKTTASPACGFLSQTPALESVKLTFPVFSMLFPRRTTQFRGFGGTGLGLAISKKIIDLMNGRIWAKNNPDKGNNLFL
jgi:signal transduction histidine kinase